MITKCSAMNSSADRIHQVSKESIKVDDIIFIVPRSDLDDKKIKEVYEIITETYNFSNILKVTEVKERGVWQDIGKGRAIICNFIPSDTSRTGPSFDFIIAEDEDELFIVLR